MRLLAEQYPAYKRAGTLRRTFARSNTFITDDACHLAPRAVRMPR